jgi:dienelactone hydrolase
MRILQRSNYVERNQSESGKDSETWMRVGCETGGLLLNCPMKFVVFFFFLCIQSGLAMAQKYPLDYSALECWPQISQEQISNDGKWIIYTISSKRDGEKLCVAATDSSWRVDVKGATNAFITGDSKRVIFKDLSDSLSIMELDSRRMYHFDRASSYQTALDGNGEWLIYRRKDEAEALVLLNLFTRKQNVYNRIDSYVFCERGTSLILQQGTIHDNERCDSLTLVDLKSGDSRFIWRGMAMHNLTIDKSGSQIAFLAGKDSSDNRTLLWYYKVGMDHPKVLVCDTTPGMEGLTLSVNQIDFANDGKNLFIYIHALMKSDLSGKGTSSSNVIVWSYADNELFDNPGLAEYKTEFRAVINLEIKKRVIRLEDSDREYADGTSDCENNLALVYSNELALYKWPSSERTNLYLVSTIDGSRVLLKSHLIDLQSRTVGFSPKGEYFIWFDRVEGHWFSYSLRTGRTINITKNIPFRLNSPYGVYASFSGAEGIAGWFDDASAVLVYDNYDIWKVDPNGIKPPVNITLGYGRRHHTIFRILDLDTNKQHFNCFKINDTLVLSAFNTISKFSGFSKLELGQNNKLINLPMYPLSFHFKGIRYPAAYQTIPDGPFVLRAKDAELFVLKPTGVDLFPNICVTADFIHFKFLTNFEPQRQFYWYKNELIRWRRKDGSFNEGIIFKPEDFNPKKKYPLIVYIYERFTDAKYVFLKPGLSGGDLNIPWYVSHGYLIFTPDIHYTIGYPGESALNSVISGVQYLSQMPWVDTKKMGLQGHSFGGYEVNYIVTRTNVFAAAAPASGMSDLISESGQLWGGSGMQSLYLSGQPRIGATLWGNPNLYIRNSPIMKANEVTTPILILHNTLDNAVHFSQSIEWFTALRHLGKKVWMLQYTNENHSIENEENSLDYTIRLSQFFDHFLKGTPAPHWMKGE